MPPVDPLAASRSSRFRVGLGAAIVLVLVGIGVTVLVAALGASGGHQEVIDAPQVSTGNESSLSGANPTGAGASGAEIYVHVLGAVNMPGLYVFREGDRAIDAVAAAAGYTEDADRRAVNLARFLSDGEQIVVPTQAESESGTPLGSTGTVGGKVNLNTADAATLETLPRVGPSLSARIIAWREQNGRFASVEDLMSVSGIGEKTFAGLKDLVTV